MENDFEQLLDKRHRKETTQEEDELIMRLVREDPEKAKQMKAHEDFIRGLYAYNYKKRLDILLEEKKNIKEVAVSPFTGFFKNPVAIAASFILFIGIGLAIFYFWGEDDYDDPLGPVTDAGDPPKDTNPLTLKDSLETKNNPKERVEAKNNPTVPMQDNGNGMKIIPYYEVDNIEDLNNLDNYRKLQFKNVEFIDLDEKKYDFDGSSLTIYTNRSEFPGYSYSYKLVYVKNLKVYYIKINREEIRLKIGNDRPFN